MGDHLCRHHGADGSLILLQSQPCSTFRQTDHKRIGVGLTRLRAQARCRSHRRAPEIPISAAELAVVQEQHHDGIERAVLRPDERRQVGMSIGERAERRLDRRGLHVNRLTPPMRSAKRFVKRIRGIQQWAVPGEAGQAFAISSISLSNTAQTRSLSCEKNSRVTNGGTPRLGLGRSNTSDGNV